MQVAVAVPFASGVTGAAAHPIRPPVGTKVTVLAALGTVAPGKAGVTVAVKVTGWVAMLVFAADEESTVTEVVSFETVSVALLGGVLVALDEPLKFASPEV